MGESERYLDRRFKRIKLGEDNNALVALIAINAVGFVILGLVQVIYYMLQPAGNTFAAEVLPWFVLPAKLSLLATAPWTLLTSMFFHTSIILTFTNLLWLWGFGSICQDVAGNKRVIPIYIYGGLAGAVLFIISSYAIPALRGSVDNSWLVGANASIMAIAVATTTLAPNYRLFRMLNGGIPIWVLTILYVIIDYAGIGGAGSAHYIAHLGGGVAGFVFVVLLRKGYDLSDWMIKFYYWFMNLFNPNKKTISVQSATKEKMFYKTGTQKPYEKRSIVTQQRIDEILDKINQKGYHLLSEEEKNILKRVSETEF